MKKDLYRGTWLKSSAEGVTTLPGKKKLGFEKGEVRITTEKSRAAQTKVSREKDNTRGFNSFRRAFGVTSHFPKFAAKRPKPRMGQRKITQTPVTG